jgi:NAD(P)-dependent dehydrogenase (short-subunit alcohol dehydrogenase family)
MLVEEDEHRIVAPLDLVPPGYRVDVRDRDGIARAVRGITKAYGEINGLINAAAVDNTPGAPEPSLSEVIDTNLIGTANTIAEVAPFMAEGAAIINIGSIYGTVSPDQRIYKQPMPLAHSMSKGGLLGLTRWWATALAPKIRVNLLTLGGIEFGMGKAFRNRFSRLVPLGRPAHMSEFDEAIRFLLGRGSRYMTGAELVIDGGYTAR